MSTAGGTVHLGEIDLVTGDTLAELAGGREPPCVSILLPTHTAGPETRQDPIRFSNLVRTAEQRLVDEHGLRARDVAGLLAAARHLVGDREFWRYQSDGLAFYAAPGFTRALRVPLPLDEDVMIGPSFRTRPLLSVLAGDGHFFILALSVNSVRLFEATRFTIAELPLGPVPASMAEALAHEDPEAQLQVRAGGQAGMFHGHGVGDEIDKQTLERYFRAVDRALWTQLRSDRAPLVLAAVGYYLPIYRAVATHPALAARAVEGSPEGHSPRELHAAAWEIVAPMFASGRDDAADRLRTALATGRAVAGAGAVAEAAAAGRVEVLFLADDEPAWGRVQSGHVEVHAHRRQGDVDVLERAAVDTLTAGGAAYTHVRDQLPGTEAAAAVLRW